MAVLNLARAPDACGKSEVRKGIILGGALGVTLTMWYFLAMKETPRCGLTAGRSYCFCLVRLFLQCAPFQVVGYRVFLVPENFPHFSHLFLL
jgi:hypothetical protein